MQYDIVTGAGSTAGDLSNGVVLAQTGSSSGSLSPVTTGDDRVSIGTLTINTADVASGKAIVAFAEASDTDDMTINLSLKMLEKRRCIFVSKTSVNDPTISSLH